MAVPPRFWGEAIRTAVYILNRCSTRALSGVTPYEAWHGRKPNVHHMRVFGCVAHVKKVGPGISKLSDRSTKMLFIGYEEASKCYCVYDPTANKLQVLHDVVFEENRAWNWDVEREPTPAATSFNATYVLEDGTVEVDNGA
jgi:hypothetical protein